MVKILTLSISFFAFSLWGAPDPSEIDYVQFSNAISNEIIEKVNQRFDVSLSSTAGGAMDVIRGFSFGFHASRAYTEEEARRIIIECSEIALTTINSSREGRPYFVEFPMTENHISFVFFVPREANNIAPMNSFLQSFGSDKNRKKETIIRYRYVDVKSDKETHVDEKSFEEAQRIVQEERKQDPMFMQQLYKKSYLEQKNEKSKEGASFISKMADLIDVTRLISGKGDKYFGPPEERAMCWSLDAFCKKLAKQHRLQFFRVGDFVAFCSGQDYNYGFSFLGSQRLSLQEARLLGAETMKALVHELNTSDKVQAWREKYFEEGHYWASDSNKDVPLEEICMKIAFWDKNNDRIMPPNTAQIAFLEKQLQYFEADPQTQKLRLVFSESYEEAMKFLESEK